jgi:hypothetical protein
MGKINVARVILGGLLAGLIINISEFILNLYVIAEESNAIMERLGLPEVGTNQIAVFVVMAFVLGIVVIFLYAGLRPRFGAGVKTAVIAALIVWVVAMMGGISDVVIGLTPANLIVIAGAWTLVETIVAAVAGAWVYKESV